MNRLRVFLTTNPWLRPLILLFLGWRVMLFVLSIMAPYFLNYDPTFPYAEAILVPSNLPQWLYSWGNFDGVHYLTIVEKGYLSANFIQAFFPVFPLLLKVTTFITSSALISGLVVSNVFTLINLILWFYLLKESFSVKHAWIGTLIWLSFPTAFFLGAVYNESLFITLVLGSFLAAYKKKWLVAGILAGLASGTRIVGVFLGPALLIEWLIQYRTAHESWPPIAIKLLKAERSLVMALLLSLVGLVSYMVYLHFNFGDALYFFHVQSEFGAGRQESLVLYPQVVWRSLKILLTARPFDLRYLTYVQEFVAGTAGLLLILLGFLKRIRLSYLFFALMAFILPTLTGTFSSMGRYVLVCFPIFMLLTDYLHNRPKVMIGYCVLSGLLLAINVVLFIQGYWVA